MDTLERLAYIALVAWLVQQILTVLRNGPNTRNGKIRTMPDFGRKELVS